MVDGGASMAPLRHAEPWTEGGRGLEQRRHKASLIAEAYALGGIDGLALGGNDWALGPEFLWGLVKDHELPVLAANLSCDTTVPVLPGRTVEVGGHRVALVGVTEGEVEGCTVEDPVAAARTALDALRPYDLSVGLVPFRSKAEVFAMGEAGLDLIIDGQGRHALGSVERAGQTLLYGAGSRGKHIGVLEATWVDGGNGWAPEGLMASIEAKIARFEERTSQLEERLQQETEPVRVTRLEAQIAAYERQLEGARTEREQVDIAGAHRLAYREVALSEEVPDHAPTADRVKRALKAMLEAEGSPIRYHLEPHVALEKSIYAGSDLCVGCHQAQHAQWSTTSHARAWQTLVQEQRHLDLDCYGCHATGVGQRGGPSSPARVVGMRDVQCEACHGPAKAHSQRPMSVKPVRVPEVATCERCHDGDKDGGRFEKETYWPKVLHTSPGSTL